MPLNEQRLLAGGSRDVFQRCGAEVGDAAIQWLELVDGANQRRSRADDPDLLHRCADGQAVRVVKAVVHVDGVEVQIGGQHEGFNVLAAEVLRVGEHAHLRVAQAQIQCASGDQVVRVAIVAVVQVAKLDTQGADRGQVEDGTEALCIEVTHGHILGEPEFTRWR